MCFILRIVFLDILIAPNFAFSGFINKDHIFINDKSSETVK